MGRYIILFTMGKPLTSTLFFAILALGVGMKWGHPPESCSHCWPLETTEW